MVRVTETEIFMDAQDASRYRLEPMGTLLRRLRTDAGLSQRALARALMQASGNDAVDREQVARWERGRRVPSRYWRTWIGLVLGVSEDELQQAAAVSRLLRSVPAPKPGPEHGNSQIVTAPSQI